MALCNDCYVNEDMMDQEKIEMLLKEPVVLAAIIIPLIIIFITQITMQKTSIVEDRKSVV